MQCELFFYIYVTYLDVLVYSVSEIVTPGDGNYIGSFFFSVLSLHPVFVRFFFIQYLLCLQAPNWICKISPVDSVKLPPPLPLPQHPTTPTQCYRPFHNYLSYCLVPTLNPFFRSTAPPPPHTTFYSLPPEKKGHRYSNSFRCLLQNHPFDLFCSELTCPLPSPQL